MQIKMCFTCKKTYFSKLHLPIQAIAKFGRGYQTEVHIPNWSTPRRTWNIRAFTNAPRCRKWSPTLSRYGYARDREYQWWEGTEREICFATSCRMPNYYVPCSSVMVPDSKLGDSCHSLAASKFTCVIVYKVMPFCSVENKV